MMATGTLPNYILPALACLLCTAGCGHDVSYVSAKKRAYISNPAALFDLKPTQETLSEIAGDSRGRHVSNTRVERSRPRDPNIVGQVYIQDSDQPELEPMIFSIRKEKRAYMAETPLFDSFELGDKTITSNFSIGRHKDHKFMAGIVFRMQF